MSIALMYHGVYSDAEDLSRITPEDRPYAVKLADFEAQMLQLAASNLRHGLIDSVQGALPDVIVTFDDGHISNRQHALPVLLRHAIPAVFFVTTGFIGRRPHFCQWEDLLALSRAGMQIGTHGTSHGFFDDMAPARVREELSGSRDQVQDKLGVSVNSMSFPGGRYNKFALRMARELGYSQVFGSEFGVLGGYSGADSSIPLRRLPVRQGTTLTRFSQMIHADPRLFFVERAKAQGKHLLKKSLGNQIYHGLYTTFAKRH